MSGLIEARIYHLPKEAKEAATNCSAQLGTSLLYPPLTEFLSACAQTDPILGLALELRNRTTQSSYLGIYVVLPWTNNPPALDGPRPIRTEPSAQEAVSGFNATFDRQVRRLGIPIISHTSFVFTLPRNTVLEKLKILEAALDTTYRLSFIPMVVDRKNACLEKETMLE